MREVDFIIVGQGLAGTCLAWELRGLGASVVVLASRIWLTVLEVIPGALFLMAAAFRRGAPSSPPS